MYVLIDKLKKKITKTVNNMPENEQELKETIQKLIKKHKLFFIIDDVHYEMPPDEFPFSRWQRCSIKFERQMTHPKPDDLYFAHLMRWMYYHDDKDSWLKGEEILIDLLSTAHLLEETIGVESWMKKLNLNEDTEAEMLPFFHSEVSHISDFKTFLGDEIYQDMLKETKRHFNP